jgi:hypothetical protein
LSSAAAADSWFMTTLIARERRSALNLRNIHGTAKPPVTLQKRQAK